MHHTKILLFSSFCNPSLQNFGSSALSRVKINHSKNIRGVHLRPYHYRQSCISFTSTRLHTKISMSDSTKNITDIRKQKQLLRKQIRSRIRSVYPSPSSSTSDDDINAAKMRLTSQSNQVFDQLFKLPQYEAASSIGFFLSMPFGEIQTRDAIQRMVNEDGKTLYVPRVGMNFELCDMDLVRCDSNCDSSNLEGKLFYDNFPTNRWNIPEPPTTNSNVATPGDIDLLIVPGLAFDCNLHRLGQGKGYYDRFIAKMNAATDTEKKMLLVGVCLEEQFLKDGTIPISDHDFIMDMVLTPSEKF
ncbi:5-formyltetrahydrofolate cyclo-ligase [Skeletonema marinoi]|uniref:5-formyltetrahydrofolate cyclo-ligase n=1 Tax=Skeletonema marinoi TaxID=267567 RepID=A0AAD8YHB3_9STRA|nr:5-formyltetrahydrofolate cyclo-ligase [Skeletonema marinoi]